MDLVTTLPTLKRKYKAQLAMKRERKDMLCSVGYSAAYKRKPEPAPVLTSNWIISPSSRPEGGKKVRYELRPLKDGLTILCAATSKNHHSLHF